MISFMISIFRSFISSQRPFIKLTAIFLLYLIVYIVNQYIDGSFFSIVQILGGFLLYFGTGIAIIMILQGFIKRKFDVWEFIPLSFISGIIILALMLQTEFLIRNQVADWYPIANGLVLWIIAGVMLYFGKTSFPVFTFSKNEFIRHPLSIVFIFGFFFTVIQVFMYPTLPDLDPYKWLLKFTYQFSNHLLDYAERPLFGSFIFTGTHLLGINILVFFKYIFPFLFLMVLFPAWMVAREFQDRRKQFIWLLFIFISPSIILYAQTAMPQSILIILAFFIVFFLLHSYQKKDDFFLYFSGAIALISFFFHQAGIIIFAIWFFITLVKKGLLLFKDKRIAIMSILLLVTNVHYFKDAYIFLSSWISIVYSRILLPDNFNPYYPAQYLNVDKISMGWNSFGGVIKFYAFHVGPLILGLMLIFLVIFIINSKFRSFFAKETTAHAPLSIIFGIFILYFTIAEILTRFPNIALLPDRAWIFAGIFSFILLFMLFKHIKKVSSLALSIFIALLVLVLTGTTYVNYLKRHLTTPAQIESGKWIENKLPQDRFFISYGHKVFLPIYTNTPLITVSSDLYCEKDLAKLSGIIDITNVKIEPKISYIPPISQSAKLTKFISVEHVYGTGEITIENLKNKPRYIYYARQHPLNPYYSRPHAMQAWGMKPCPDGKFIFDEYTNKFKRVYYTKDEEVIIWKIL